PCDPLNRGYTYGPIWLAFSFIPLDIADTGWLGWLLGFCFLSSFVFLPATKRPWELALMTLACISTMVVFAVERANADIIVFMVAAAIGYLATLRRFPAYALIIAAGLFKYYPITMLILAVRERLRVLFAIIAIAFCIGVLFISAYYNDLQRGVPLIAIGSYFDDLFAAKDLPFGFVEIAPWFVSPSIGQNGTAWLVYAFLGLEALLVCFALVRKNLVPTLSWTERDQVFLVIGCALIVGCFFAGQSIGYRGIAFLFALPGFLALARKSRTVAQKRVTLFTSGAI